MTKNFLKEFIIALLLCLAIILLLGILLYEYVPMSKTVPTPVTYTTPEEAKKELQDTQGIDEEKVIMTYKIDSNDLNNYKRTQTYNPGKANPFSSYESSEPSGGQNNGSSNGNSSTGGGNSGNNASSNPSSGNDNTSGGVFFQKKGTK